MFPSSRFKSPVVRFCFTICSILCKNCHPVQNLMQILQCFDLKYDCYQSIEGLEHASAGVQAMVQQCMTTDDLQFTTFF